MRLSVSLKATLSVREKALHEAKASFAQAPWLKQHFEGRLNVEGHTTQNSVVFRKHPFQGSARKRSQGDAIAAQGPGDNVTYKNTS